MTINPNLHTVPVRRPWDVVVVAGFAILAGFAEVVTGFSHTFFGITTSGVALFTVAAAGIGLSYLASGILMLTMKKWAALRQYGVEAVQDLSINGTWSALCLRRADDDHQSDTSTANKDST